MLILLKISQKDDKELQNQYLKCSTIVENVLQIDVPSTWFDPAHHRSLGTSFLQIFRPGSSRIRRAESTDSRRDKANFRMVKTNTSSFVTSKYNEFYNFVDLEKKSQSAFGAQR